MNIERDILDPSWMCLEGTFDQQVARLFYHVRLSKDQVEEDLLSLFNDVERCKLTPYGSLYQGTGFKTSDVDCCIYIPIQHQTSTYPFVITARDVFSRYPDVFAQLSADTNLPEHIVKFFHIPTNRRCDLAFNYTPGCELRPFGSLHQGTGLKTSDVDCFLDIPAHLKPATDMVADTTRHILSGRPDVFTRLSMLTQGPVQLVKFFHLPTSRACDVIFSAPQGLRCSRLLRYLLHLDKRALDLAVLVKYWAKVHKITGPYLLKKYALTLMVIFYLQQLGMLPTVEMLQRNARYNFWEEWNIAFEESTYLNNNQLSLKELLGGFFVFFSSYDFEGSIISTFVGRTIERENFKTVSDIPNDFVLYRNNLRKKSCEPLQLETPMCVQDVFDHSRNCTAEVSSELTQNIKACFKLAAKLYKSESDERFLKPAPRKLHNNYVRLIPCCIVITKALVLQFLYKIFKDSL